MKIRQVLDSTESLQGRLFDAFIQITILVSIASMTIDSMHDLSPRAYQILNWTEIICVGIFTIELLLRLCFSGKGWRYLFTFFGIVDVLAILPFYLSLGVDLRGIRAFRLLRVFRLFKLARYNQAMLRFKKAFVKAKEDLILFGAIALVIIYLSAVGIHLFESEVQPDKFGSIPQCVWWAVSTLTTVGYGDVYPVTNGGKTFTLLILTVGLAAVAVPTGILASALTEVRKEKQQLESNSEESNQNHPPQE